MGIWARKLGGFSDMPDAIKSVLDHLPADPPSLPEFVNLCREAAKRYAERIQKIEQKRTDEEKERAEEFAKNLAKTVIRDRRDHKDWAKKLRARHEDGERLSQQQVSAYQEAMAGEIDEPKQAIAA